MVDVSRFCFVFEVIESAPGGAENLSHAVQLRRK